MSAGRLLLDLPSLSAQFPGPVFEAGLALYRGQQVLDCSIARVNTQEWSLTGTVRAGGKSAPCDVTAVLETSPDGTVTFFSGHGSCSAPRNCKHSAALAVKAHYQSARTHGAFVPAAKALEDSDGTRQMPAVAPSPSTAHDLLADTRESDMASDSDTPSTPPQQAATPTRSAALPDPPRRAALGGPSLDLFGDSPDEPAAAAAASAAAKAIADTSAPQADRTLENLPPVAHLHIAPTPADLVEQRGLMSATLRFQYGSVFHYAFNDYNPILIDTPATDTEAAHTALLHRDLPTEHGAHHRLKALGLSGDSQGRFVRPFISSAQQQTWLQWLDEDFTTLRAAGFVVTTSPELAHWIARADSFEARMQAEAGDLADQGGGTMEADARDGSQTPWFRLSLGMRIAGERRNILPLLPELLSQLSTISQGAAGQSVHGSATGPTLQLPPYLYLRRTHADGGAQGDDLYWRLPCEPLRPWLQALLDLLAGRGIDHATRDEFSQPDLLLSRQEALRLGTALHADSAAAHGRPEPVWLGADTLHLLASQLAGQQALPDIAPPAGLQADLRPYQLQGLRWLQFLRAHQLGGILADDMGLGKTLQTLAHIQAEKEAGRLDRPVLILAPVSLMGNWRREASRFTPSLRVGVLHGHKRHRVAARLGERDMVIASYSFLQRDHVHWRDQAWHIVVLDEAQNIKNASSQAARLAGELQTRHRLCLSGTPIENHLGELWSLFNFLMPGFLGSAARFRALYRTPIEKQGDHERLAQLRRRVAPFMLRRTKQEVATDLPAKQESVASIVLGDAQADLYEAIRLSTEKTVRDTLANKGLANAQVEIVTALTRLRQVCCDPRLLPPSPGSASKPVPASAKLEWLMQSLPDMIAEGRRVLLFSQFTGMLALIEDALRHSDIRWVKLTGQSQQRDQLIERFTSGAVPLFLISLKAGGVGLNLPQADTVIHYDPWWNPAIQNQATDRAHRIGQTQPVLVYQLVAQGTVEERILALQQRKASLADSLYDDVAVRSEPMLNEQDLAALLEPMGAPD
ncbi:MAG: DEAD/DEAH box helicase [Polaromonas sp.]|nr:DEAD/DEAH box helicase [Polaromonas sp.]